ncbi:MAG: coiled-coil domain-containing protein [Hyphomicrobiales bacterium]
MNKAERPMAQTLNIDTLEFSRRMKEGGVEEKAAETIARTVAEAIGSSDVATGTQLTLTKTELKSEIGEVRSEINKVRTELKSEITEVRSELKSDIAEVKSGLNEVHIALKDDMAELKVVMANLMPKILGMGAVLVTLINALFKYVLN